MNKAKGLIVFTAIGLMFISFALTGCGGPNEKELQALEETKAAALAAESSQADCESEKAQLESQLAAKKQELKEMKQEQADVNKRLAAMGN
jgi:ABC-type microcin C transport system permease subunit YejB